MPTLLLQQFGTASIAVWLLVLIPTVPAGILIAVLSSPKRISGLTVEIEHEGVYRLNGCGPKFLNSLREEIAQANATTTNVAAITS